MGGAASRSEAPTATAAAMGDGEEAPAPAPAPPPGADAFWLPAEWAERAQRELAETPAAARENVRALRALLAAEPDLSPRADDGFLLAFLRARKHGLQEAFEMVKRYYRTRAAYPDYFEICLPDDREDLYALKGLNLLPERHPSGAAIIYMQSSFDPSLVTSQEIIKCLSHALDLLMLEPLTQIAGVLIVVNMSGLGVRHLRLLNPSMAIIGAGFLQGVIPLRYKSFIVCNEPPIFRPLLAIVLPLLKDKIRKRLLRVGNDLAALHSRVPAAVLPPQLGGAEQRWAAELPARLRANSVLIREWAVYGYRRG